MHMQARPRHCQPTEPSRGVPTNSQAVGLTTRRMAPGQRGVCVVLGAGLDGIGGAIASRFAAEGFTVVVSKRKPEPLEALVERITAQGWHAVAHSADARSRTALELPRS